MSQTIDDFRDFYAPSSKIESFSLHQEIKEVLELMHFEDISVDLKSTSSTNITSYKNQYKHRYMR